MHTQLTIKVGKRWSTHGQKLLTSQVVKRWSKKILTTLECLIDKGFRKMARWSTGVCALTTLKAPIDGVVRWSTPFIRLVGHLRFGHRLSRSVGSLPTNRLVKKIAEQNNRMMRTGRKNKTRLAAATTKPGNLNTQGL
jgi:hypothetical protein